MKLIRKFVTVGTMCLFFAGVIGQAGQGQQRTTSLFSSNCVQNGPSDTMRSSQRDISIGREVFTEIFVFGNIYMGPPENLLLTCRIKPAGSQARFKTLRLAFGVADNQSSNKPVTVNVYLDGNLAASKTLSVGEKSLLLLDVSRIGSVALEVPENSGTKVSFIQALLEPISSSPGQRQ